MTSSANPSDNKLAFIFPGQGSQSVGMLNAFSDWPIVNETLEEASNALNQDLGKLIAEGPANELNLTTNTQPAMLTAAYAIYRAWRSIGGRAPDIVAGHSLGEYTALTVAGTLAFDDALRLVRFRAQAMQAAVPINIGGMAAIIGLEEEVVKILCAQVSSGSDSLTAIGTVEVVNFNAPAQQVIAGHQAAVDKACEIAKAQGAKRALRLPVSAPFHSSLMKPASQQLQQYLSAVNMREPKISVINNIDAAIESSVAAIKDALVRQAAGPVRWVECVRAIARENITHIIECGPGKVLTGLVKRIDPKLIAAAMDSPESIHSLNDLKCA